MAARCKKCGAPIIWIKTPKGKWIHCNEGLHEYRADDDGPQVLINDSGKAIRCRLTFLGKADGLAGIDEFKASLEGVEVSAEAQAAQVKVGPRGWGRRS